MGSQLGSFRLQVSSTDWAIALASGGSLSGGTTYYFFLQFQNRVGRNLLSDFKSVSPAAGEKVQWTINSGAIRSGEEVFEVVLSCSETNDPSTAKQIAKWKYREVDQVSLRSLPETIDFSSDDDLGLFTVADSSGLPANMLNGKLLYVTADAKYYELDNEAVSGDYPASPSGYWSEVTYPPYLTDTTAIGGADRNQALIQDYLLPPTKVGDSDSIFVNYWLQNKILEGGSALPVGYGLSFQLFVNGSAYNASGLSYNAVFSDLVEYQILGIVRKSTGVLDSAISTGVETWNDSVPYSLPVELLAGYALSLNIRLSFSPGELNGRVPDGALISVLLVEEGLRGQKISFPFGDCIFPDSNRLRIYPNLRSGGKCAVDEYISPLVSSLVISGLAADTADQILAISAARASDVTVRASVEELYPTEAIRAIVSTENGVSDPSSVSNTLTLALNDAIQVTVTHSVDGSGLWDIRSDYPDITTGDSAIADTSPPEIRVYIEDVTGGLLYQYPSDFAVLASASQVLSITDISGLILIGSIPTNASDFNLFPVNTPVAAALAGLGNFTAGDWRVYIAYNYPSPNSVITKTRHTGTFSGVDLIPELALTLAEVMDYAQYYRLPVTTVAEMRSLVSSELVGFHLRANKETEKTYIYNPNSVETDDSLNFIKPSAGTGLFEILGGCSGINNPELYAIKSANYTVTLTDKNIEVDTSAVTITLLTAVGNSGLSYQVINTSNGQITIDTTSSQTIGNLSTGNPLSITLESGEVLKVISNGFNWRII